MPNDFNDFNDFNEIRQNLFKLTGGDIKHWSSTFFLKEIEKNLFDLASFLAAFESSLLLTPQNKVKLLIEKYSYGKHPTVCFMNLIPQIIFYCERTHPHRVTHMYIQLLKRLITNEVANDIYQIALNFHHFFTSSYAFQSASAQHYIWFCQKLSLYIEPEKIQLLFTAGKKNNGFSSLDAEIIYQLFESDLLSKEESQKFTWRAKDLLEYILKFTNLQKREKALRDSLDPCTLFGHFFSKEEGLLKTISNGLKKTIEEKLRRSQSAIELAMTPKSTSRPKFFSTPITPPTQSLSDSALLPFDI